MAIQAKISEVLIPEISRFYGSRYAILDFPNYLNPGDSAIWMGTRAILETLLGCAPSYVSTIKQFDERQCHQEIGRGPVFFLGGGNFGDLYQKHNQRRLGVLKNIQHNPAVFLPFSIANSSIDVGNGVSEIHSALSNHCNTIFFTREQRTFETFSRNYGRESILCPDLAHFITPLNGSKRGSALSLFREDAERYGHSRREHTTDWAELPKMKLTNRLGKLTSLVPPGKSRLRLYDMLAAQKTRIAMRAIGSSCHLTTDRLHGIILASEMKIPVDAYDNATGKVLSYVATWKDYLGEVTPKS